MSQTYLAVGALALLGLLTLNTRRGQVSDDRRAVGVQSTALANRVAVDVLDGLRALPFDTTSAYQPAVLASQLHAHLVLDAAPADRFSQLGTRAAAAATGAGTLAGVDGAVRTVVREAPGGDTRFEVATVVGYVGADGATPTATPTALKVVTARVRPLDWQAPDLYVSQLYACGAACAW